MIHISLDFLFLYIFLLQLYVKYIFLFNLSFQNDSNVKVTATCIRVPVMRAHAESVNLQFEKPLDEVTIYFCYTLSSLNEALLEFV